MPQWAGLPKPLRYIDPHNTEELADEDQTMVASRYL